MNNFGSRIREQRKGERNLVSLMPPVKFLACDTATPYVDHRPFLVPGKPELREHKAVLVLNDEEIGIFNHELVVNCAP